MHPIPQAVWNKVANFRKLRTWWAEVMFNLEDEDLAQKAQETVSETLRERNVPEATILAYLTLLPLLMEPDAIRSFVEEHPQYLDALPEVLNRQEAIELARLEWPLMDATETEALQMLLPETQGPINELWTPAIREAVANLKLQPTETP